MNLYSRQIGTLGKDVMESLQGKSVLIIGCDTIGIETAKSLCLMGIHTITLFDNTPYTKIHTERLLYKPTTKSLSLSHAAKKFLGDLQTSTIIKVVRRINNFEEYDCVVSTNCYDQDIEKKCMDANIPFIFGVNHYLYGFVYSNFGHWKVEDVNGEPTFKGYITDYEIKEHSIKLSIHTNKHPESLLFELSSETANVSGVISSKCFKNNYLTLLIDRTPETESMLTSPNVLYRELKQPQIFDSVSLPDAIKRNEYIHIDTKNSFKKDDKMFNMYSKFILQGSNDRISFNTKFYLIGTIIGGILAQEVVKITHKFMPLRTPIFINFKAFSNNKLKYKSKKNDISLIFDKELIKKFKNLNVCMIGCGALGCEISKNLAMMGFCQNKKRNFVITDMDTIELSNLSRQFLFQPNNIGQYKSEVVKNKLKMYTPKMNVKSYNLQMCDKNSHIFNCEFWKRKDIVINALDNTIAREFVDNKCNMFLRPLFESGTLGVKGNVQTIIPHKTATYSEIKDPEEDLIPMCTIRDFPNKIEHCIEYSLGIFDALFNIPTPTDIEHLNRQQIDILSYLNKIYTQPNIHNLSQFGMYIYHEFYMKKIQELLTAHPDDSFWTGDKLKPRIFPMEEVITIDYLKDLNNVLNLSITDFKVRFPLLQEDIYNENEIPKNIRRITYNKDECNHINFMSHLVNIRAKTYNIKEINTLDVQLLSGKIVPALSTTTSIVAGFVVLDIIKYLSDMPSFTETNINIGTNQYNIYNAFRPKPTYNNMFSPEYNCNIKTPKELSEFTTWSRIDIIGKDDDVITNSDLVHYLRDNYSIDTIEMILHKNLIIYPKEDGFLLENIYTSISENYPISLKDPIELEILAYDSDENPILFPRILYTLI